MKAVLCPVCNGTGKVWVASTNTASGYETECHGCGGAGWVCVPE